ncbi:radical SAM protein [Dokdonia sp. Dokd-P16]|uniref:B12-binding domain-containing radical SAM protein n=1 Tax=Dokdonia sp. Dokd-P16 TaxID=2173169 RepID=UPI000D549C1A|nr:B12-binding domain-containing radical SAM protein [Dokdonia sp. Dokd-P16]AWH75077.1 radical SAM protein [Dokdonia sp. Dokd-P16]
MKDILLITPPFTQLNTPYPATAYIKGFLNTKDISSFQMDLGIEVILQLFSAKEFTRLFEIAHEHDTIVSDNCKRIYAMRDTYIKLLDEVVSFLQGHNQTIARQICTGNFLPRASRFDQLDDMEWAFGEMGMQDKAKHLATLFLEDLSDFIVECIDPNFGFSRYAERLGQSANSFDELYTSLQDDLTIVDEITIEILEARFRESVPKLILLSVPFPGNLYSAFRCGQWIKEHYPSVKVAMGGGFPNTELRELKDTRVFEFIDYITLDDGELPVELLVEDVVQNVENPTYKRTFILENGEVVYKNNTLRQDYKQAYLGTPDYSDLLLDQYVSVIEIANPMHSLWSDGRWNKLTMAHGCYWGKCTFCDISLDYIKIYEPIAASILVDRMEALVAQTGETGFHFVDEAAPPALMKALALEIIKRELVVTWWTNIRFEKNFTKDLCRLLKASGCIAVSGGLEVASDRLLKLIDKGVTVAQVAQVTLNFTEADIMVHSYLMYGYPTQTEQETIDSLEMVRQLFELGIIQSGFWHQFALTTHSPVGKDPESYGVTPHYNEITFANNDVDFSDSTGIDHSKFSYGLKKSLFNYMHGIGFDEGLQEWFDFEVPRTIIHPHVIEDSLQDELQLSTKSTSRILWLGFAPTQRTFKKKKRELTELTFHDQTGTTQITVDTQDALWLIDMLEIASPNQDKLPTYAALKTSYEETQENFELFWYSKAMLSLREAGLLVI